MSPGRLTPRSGRSSGRSSPFEEREVEIQTEMEEKRKQRSEAAIQWVDKEIKKVRECLSRVGGGSGENKLGFKKILFCLL